MMVVLELNILELDNEFNTNSYNYINLNCLISPAIINNAKKLNAILTKILKQRIPFFPAVLVRYKILDINDFNKIYSQDSFYLEEPDKLKPINHFFDNIDQMNNAWLQFFESFELNTIYDVQNMAQKIA